MGPTWCRFWVLTHRNSKCILSFGVECRINFSLCVSRMFYKTIFVYTFRLEGCLIQYCAVARWQQIGLFSSPRWCVMVSLIVILIGEISHCHSLTTSYNLFLVTPLPPSGPVVAPWPQIWLFSHKWCIMVSSIATWTGQTFIFPMHPYSTKTSSMYFG